MINALAILNELAAHASIVDKRRILKKHDCHELRCVLYSALNPYLMYYVRKTLEFKPATKTRHEWLYIRDNLLSSLSKRLRTGHDALYLVRTQMEQMTADDAEVLRRILRKDLRCGVGAKIVNSVWPKLIPEFKVQLASPKIKKAEFPCYVEPKFDGMRVLAFVGIDEVVFLSRNGTPVETLTEAAIDINSIFSPGTVLDGEAKSAAGGFETSMSVVKRSGKNKKPDAVRYIVFDVLTKKEFDEVRCARIYSERRQWLNDAFSASNKPAHIELSDAIIVDSMEEAQVKYREYRKRGDEGAMLKQIGGLYEFKRTAAWIKLKPSETIDVEITGYKEGKKKYEGKLGAFLFRYNGQSCSAGTGITDADRKKWWRLRKSFVGKTMEVEFTEETGKGKTRHARFHHIREDK